MSRLDRITFTSDFGWAWGYVAVCEGLMVRLNPRVQIFHLSHDVPAGDVPAGALVLERTTPAFPPAVHLAVVDPGVGTARRPLALVSHRGDLLVGPDNGLLVPAAKALGGIASAWLLNLTQIRTEAGLSNDQVSFTFHGRDLFAPAAALLSAGIDPGRIGTPADPDSLATLTPPIVEMLPESVVAEVIEIDRFGNVGLALRFADLHPQEGFYKVEVVDETLPEWTARVVHTFGELGSGELGVYCDSWGQVGLTLRSASAAQLLSIDRGMKIKLTAAPLAGKSGEEDSHP